MVTLPCTATRLGFTNYRACYTSVFSFTTAVLLLFEAVALLLLLLLLVLWVTKHAGAPSFLTSHARRFLWRAERLVTIHSSFIKPILNSLLFSVRA